MVDDGDGGALKRLEYVGVFAGAITLGFLLLGQAVEHFAQNAAESPAKVAKAKPNFNAIDYGATGSVKSGVVVIGPCDTQTQ